jgi:hypothetical protein
MENWELISLIFDLEDLGKIFLLLELHNYLV